MNVPLLLLYRRDDLLNISLPERYICAKGQDTQVSAAAVLIKDKPISLPERYICAKGQDTQVSAAAVLTLLGLHVCLLIISLIIFFFFFCLARSSRVGD